MSLYRKENGGGWDWHNIIGGLITALLIAFLAGGFNWFLGVRDMKVDIQNIRKQQKKGYIEGIERDNNMARVMTQIGECVWSHVHPREPYPFANLVVNPNRPSSNNGDEK